MIAISNISPSVEALTPTPDAESVCYGAMCCGSFTLIAITAIIVVVILVIALLIYLLKVKK